MDDNTKKVTGTEQTEPENTENTNPADENNAAVADDDNDAALDSFLSREQEDKTPAKTPMKKSRKTLLIIIGAVVLIAILVVVLILVIKAPGSSTEESTPAELTLDVNSDGVHEASVGLDENGVLSKDGAGTLLEYATADIKKINIENENGSFTVISNTPEGEATVYTIEGFEDYDLESGVADEIATHSATIEFLRVIKTDADPADYGLDKPRATVKVWYNDDTSAILRVGNDAAGEAGTYMSFGTANTVYLVNSDNVSSYLFNINDFISLSITETNEDTENAEFSTLTISGTRYDEPITLVPNTDEALEASYLVTAPVSTIANAIEANDIAGNVRGLYADSVICVNPSADHLATYGLSEPYATVKASYPDTDITLHASAPDDNGVVNLYNPDKNVIYTIQLAAVSWAKTNIDLLMPENPLPAKARCVSSIDFSDSSNDYSLELTTTSETITDESGSEQESYITTASYKGKEQDTDNFNTFFQNLQAIKNQGKAEGSGKDLVMSVKLTYTTDRSPDTLYVYTSDKTNYILKLNDCVIGTASKSYIDNLIEGVHNLVGGKTVDSL